MIKGEVSPVLAQSGQQHHLWRLYSDVSQWGGQLCFPGPGDDAHSHTGNSHTNTHTCISHQKAETGSEARKKDNQSRLDRRAKAPQRKCSGSNQWEGPVSQEGWATEDPEEVCCHSDQCGLFFFWLPLLHAGHILGSGYHDNSTTLVSHIAEIESERKRSHTEDKSGMIGNVSLFCGDVEAFDSSPLVFAVKYKTHRTKLSNDDQLFVVYWCLCFQDYFPMCCLCSMTFKVCEYKRRQLAFFFACDCCHGDRCVTMVMWRGSI